MTTLRVQQIGMQKFGNDLEIDRATLRDWRDSQTQQSQFDELSGPLPIFFGPTDTGI